MAGDIGRGRVVLFGGLQQATTKLADLWEWDGRIWTSRRFGPPARFAHGMAYDSARGVTVIFGGRGKGSDLNDTWEWDGVSWRHALPATSPPARTRFIMVYDEARARTVVYGGMTFNGTTAFSDRPPVARRQWASLRQSTSNKVKRSATFGNAPAIVADGEAARSAALRNTATGRR